MYQLWMVVAEGSDVLQLLKPLLLLNIVWTGECIGGSLLEASLYRQISLDVRRLVGVSPSVEVRAKKME